MTRLAMHRNGDPRPHPAYICASSSRRGWPVTWTSASSSVMISMPWSTRRFWIAPDRPLVAGNGARRKDHDVAGFERDLGMLVLRQCAPAPRAARPGCRCRGRRPFAGNDRSTRLLEEIGQAVEVAGFARDLDHAMHGAAGHDDFAAGGARGIRDGADARDVRGEDGDGDARWRPQ